jgi:molybdopterin-guanine dinucleotide biosynthesis protein A
MQSNAPKILGAVIAGGQSRRFGSDKALAPVGGKPMLDHVIEALRPQTGAIMICGRQWPGLETIADRPLGGIGPLAGLNAALHFAVANGFDVVLSVPVDVLPVPADVAALLGGHGPAVFDKQHLIGWWPATLAPMLEHHVREGHRTLKGWIAQSGARRVKEPPGLINVNFADDLRG